MVRCVFTEDRWIRSTKYFWVGKISVTCIISLISLTFSFFFIVKRINFYLAISASIDVIHVMLLIVQSKQKVILIIKETYLKKPIQLKYSYACHNFCVNYLLSRTNFLLLKVLWCFYPFEAFSVFFVILDKILIFFSTIRNLLMYRLLITKNCWKRLGISEYWKEFSYSNDLECKINMIWCKYHFWKKS